MAPATYTQNLMINLSIELMKSGKLLLITVVIILASSTFAVILNNGGLWPKWLGGNYISEKGYRCEDYASNGKERDFHWLICPIRSAWGLNNTGMESTAIIHYDLSCLEHGHANNRREHNHTN